jgi:hypothetical protein
MQEAQARVTAAQAAATQAQAAQQTQQAQLARQMRAAEAHGVAAAAAAARTAAREAAHHRVIRVQAGSRVTFGTNDSGVPVAIITARDGTSRREELPPPSGTPPVRAFELRVEGQAPMQGRPQQQAPEQGVPEQGGRRRGRGRDRVNARRANSTAQTPVPTVIDYSGAPADAHPVVVNAENPPNNIQNFTGSLPREAVVTVDANGRESSTGQTVATGSAPAPTEPQNVHEVQGPVAAQQRPITGQLVRQQPIADAQGRRVVVVVNPRTRQFQAQYAGPNGATLGEVVPAGTELHYTAGRDRQTYVVHNVGQSQHFAPQAAGGPQGPRER